MTQWQFRPSLAVDAGWNDFDRILKSGDTLYASPKLDGIRAVVLNGKLVSRTLKPIRNRFIQSILGILELEGLDGELIVGQPNGEGVFARTSSGVMSEWGEPDFTYHVFDNHVLGSTGINSYRDRYDALCISCEKWNRFVSSHPDCIQLLVQTPITLLEQLEAFEAEMVERQYEGAILRWSDAPYKQGRSTLRERYMLKLKRFKDSEGIVIGFQELQHNENEATIDARGFTTRSSHQTNKRSSGLLGALRLQDCSKPEWEFNCGTGFDNALRQEIWNNQSGYLGKIAKYKYLEVGVKDLPRHPVFLNWRDPSDL